MTEESPLKFSNEVLKRIAEILGNNWTGREIIELIRPFYPRVEYRLRVVSNVMTKSPWEKFRKSEAFEHFISLLYKVLKEAYESNDGFNNIVKIVEKISEPKQYISRPQIHDEVVKELNKALIYDGLKINTDNKIIQVRRGVEPRSNVRDKMSNQITIQLGKIRGYIGSLREENRKEKLERNECKNILFGLKESFQILFLIFGEMVQNKVKEIPPEAELLSIVHTGKTVEEFVKERLTFSMPISKAESLINSLDTPQYYNDNSIRKNISEYIENVGIWLIKLEEAFGIKSGLLKISELTATIPNLFTENWIVATCYLSAMEIAINKKAKELCLPTENKKFKERFDKVLKAVQGKGIEVTELDKMLSKVFWDLRHKIVHEGYNPSMDEVDLILKVVNRILTSLFRSGII